MKKITMTIFLLLTLWPLHSMAYEWKIDPAHSEIRFKIKHIYSTTSGNFSKFKGNVFFNPVDPAKSRFDFSVKVDSIDTHIGKRDSHLRSPDFFNAKKYPTMTFRSSRITHKGGNKYTLEGKLTVKDVSRDIQVEFIYWGQKQSPFNNNLLVAGFDCRFRIDRMDYHVGKGKLLKMGALDRYVDISITLEATRSK